MEVSILVIFIKISQKGKVLSNTSIKINTKANFMKERKMEEEHTISAKVPLSKEDGSLTIKLKAS